MNLNLVWAIVVRHLYHFKHSLDRFADLFYWPVMDVLLWGFTSIYIAQSQSSLSFIPLMLLSGIILWMIVWRSQHEITVNLLEEVWSQNMTNLFASPLRLREWIVGVFILGILGIFVSVSFAALVAFFIHKVNFFSFGLYLIPFMVNLTLTGWGFGLMMASLIIRFGRRLQNLAWSGIILITPFSGVYYPISVLPDWAQKVSAFLPTSYVFEGMRAVIFEGKLPWEMLIKSFLLNGLFLIIGLSLFVFMFEKTKNTGLSKTE